MTKFLFVNQPYKFIKENPHLGIKIKILYFALEESKEEFMYSLISNRLKVKYGLTVDSMSLRGLTTVLSDEIIERIEECKEYFEELERSIDIVDSVSNPFGIYKYVRGYATDNGTHHYKPHTFTHTDPDGTVRSEETMVYDRYEARDPNELVIVIVDHLSLLQPENGGQLHEAMTQMSANYGRKMITKHFNYAFVMVQQQAAESERAQYTNSGQSIEAKLEPSLQGLGDNKLTQRDSYFVIGLFAPERYQIEKHLGYDIRILKDMYRSLSIMKNRLSVPNLKLPLLFNGASNIFAELPRPNTPELAEIYEAIRRNREGS